jgi:hypothetical protein
MREEEENKVVKHTAEDAGRAGAVSRGGEWW